MEDSLKFQDTAEESNSDRKNVVNLLIPADDFPVVQILRERTLQVSTKYSHFTEDPCTFWQAISCEKPLTKRKNLIMN